MKKIIIAIDGYSGTGKSSTAKEVARILGYRYIDSGAMYRAVTLYFLENDIDPDSYRAVEKALLKIHIDFEINDNGTSILLMNGQSVEEKIRETRVSDQVSRIAEISEVRKKLVYVQQRLGSEKAIVMDGRDIGTVVFPQAELKIFMTADVQVRAQRRLKELSEKGITTELNKVFMNLQERDQIDTQRKDSPLTKAPDAIEIDTTNLTFDDQVGKIVKLADEIVR